MIQVSHDALDSKTRIDTGNGWKAETMIGDRKGCNDARWLEGKTQSVMNLPNDYFVKCFSIRLLDGLQGKKCSAP